MHKGKHAPLLYVAVTSTIAAILVFLTSFVYFNESPDYVSSLIFLILFGPVAIVFVLAEVLIFSVPAFSYAWRVKKYDSLMTFVWCVATPAAAAYLLGTVAAALIDRRHEYFSYFEILQFHGAVLAVPAIALLISGILSVPVLMYFRARYQR